MTTTVNFETSKLLKEKEFNIPTLYFYLDGSLKYNHSIKPRNSNVLPGTMDVSAPTITDAVMWLYEKHGIWIISSYELNIENHKKEWFWIAIKDGEEIAYQYRDFNSPTEAYEAAIEFTLENLI